MKGEVSSKSHEKRSFLLIFMLFELLKLLGQGTPSPSADMAPAADTAPLRPELDAQRIEALEAPSEIRRASERISIESSSDFKRFQTIS